VQGKRAISGLPLTNLIYKRRAPMKNRLFVMIFAGLFILSGIAFAEGTPELPSTEKEVKISESTGSAATSDVPATKQAVQEAAEAEVKAAEEVRTECPKAALTEKKAEAYSTENK
jgi:hypothetical protein